MGNTIKIERFCSRGKKIMDSLRKRMVDYLSEGQLLDSDVSEEITTNLIDVVSWWLEDVSDSIHEESPRDDVFAILREEMGSAKTIEI